MQESVSSVRRVAAIMVSPTLLVGIHAADSGQHCAASCCPRSLPADMGLTPRLAALQAGMEHYPRVSE